MWLLRGLGVTGFGAASVLNFSEGRWIWGSIFALGGMFLIAGAWLDANKEWDS